MTWYDFVHSGKGLDLVCVCRSNEEIHECVSSLLNYGAYHYKNDSDWWSVMAENGRLKDRWEDHACIVVDTWGMIDAYGYQLHQRKREFPAKDFVNFCEIHGEEFDTEINMETSILSDFLGLS